MDKERLLALLGLSNDELPEIKIEVNMLEHRVAIDTKNINSNGAFVTYLEFALFEFLKASGVDKSEFKKTFDEMLDAAFEEKSICLTFNGVDKGENNED